ncbi:MAG: penicillin-binding protein 1C [Calditrichae bacterium]|nr:penicillin-binding protein 1C [Calditrichia bacterium]
MEKHYFNKNYLISLALIIILFILAFRLIPSLLPVKPQDLQREEFHSVLFYDRHGNLMQEVLSASSTRSVSVDINAISPYLLDAMVATEDKNFYSHNGIDYGAVLRALYQNISSAGIVSGASTITLQLARLQHSAERTILNKIREAFYAYRLEAGLDKKTILESYQNRLPMGGNLYGVEGAARAYFGVAAADLTLAQATFLAAIPNSPNRLNPYRNPGEIKKRQKTILERMVQQKMIEETRISGVLKEDVLLKPQTSSFAAPHLVFQLMQELPINAQSVRTTIDMELQQMVAEQIKQVLFRLKNYQVTNAAALLLDNHSGEILAYVGSADYFNEEIDGQYDGIQALRQPGSALKPFLYLLALEKEYNPASVISDIPSHYRMPTGVYSPRNYSESFHGPVRIREALANSLNVPAVRMLAKLEIDSFLHRLHEYEFHSLNREPEFYGIGLALGCGEVTLYELSRAYLCLARLGDFLPVKAVTYINDNPTDSIDFEKNISNPALNYLITHMLSDHHARTMEFGFSSILNLPFPCAAKTGTSYKFCDNWTIGYTRDFTLGVWVGNFDHKPMLKVSGVSGAGPIFANTMVQLYRGKPWPEDFSEPPGIARITICPLSGKKPNPACPSRIEELIPQRDLAEHESGQCEMHIRVSSSTKTIIPAEFRSWAEPLGYEVRYTETSAGEFIRILHPKDGATYYRLPNLAPEFQSIRIEAECANKQATIDWYLNGKLLRSTQNPHGFLWQISPGSFRLRSVINGDRNTSKEVSFNVK